MRSLCRFRGIGRVNPGTDRNPRCTPVLSSLRHTPRGVDFINTCGHFSKVVTKSDSWKNIFKNFRVPPLTERCDDLTDNTISVYQDTYFRLWRNPEFSINFKA